MMTLVITFKDLQTGGIYATSSHETTAAQFLTGYIFFNDIFALLFSCYYYT